MNSALTLQEEKQGTSSISASSIEGSAFPKYRIPRVPLARPGTATTAEAMVLTTEEAIYTYFVTAPRIVISGFYETGITTRKTRVMYKKQEAIEALLGDKGKHVLSRVIELIEGASLKSGWPLRHVEVAHVEDAEVENWQYALMTLVFDSDFEVADEYLHNFYNKLDSLADALDVEGQDILQRKLFFDVATAV